MKLHVCRVCELCNCVYVCACVCVCELCNCVCVCVCVRVHTYMCEYIGLHIHSYIVHAV